MDQNGIIRWGILGAGSIVNIWIRGARQVEGMEIAAVASRTPQTAQAMAQRHGIPEALSYEEMIARDDIDVVYIPVPHSAHKALTLKALRAGKHVLVEKPAAVNAGEFREMAACAEENHVFLMEGMWMRFFPVLGRIPDYLGEKGIGPVRLIQSAFAFRMEENQIGGRLTDPMAAGGSLLDTGVYALHFTDVILNREPVKLTGLAAIDTDDLHLRVDEQASYVASFDRGELAVMTSAIRTAMPDTAYIFGTRGSIEIPVFWKPTRLIVRIGGRETETVEIPVPQRIPGIEDSGFQYEVAHVNECLRKGLTESPVLPWAKTIRILRQCDSLRAQWGLKYPFE